MWYHCSFNLRSLSYYLLFLFVASTKHHLALASGGFHEKTGRLDCLWSPFAALDYAVGSCGRILMRVQMSESNTKNSILFSHGVVCACVCVCLCVHVIVAGVGK